MAGSCSVSREDGRVCLQSPFFAYTLDTRRGLRAQSWENRQLAAVLDLGSGSELDVDVDQASDRLWIEGWKVMDTGRGGPDPDRESGYLRGYHRSDCADGAWEGCQTPAMVDAFHFPADHYRWARTHLELPESCRAQELTLVIGGIGLLDFRFMRVFVNGVAAATREVSQRWHLPAAISLGPSSAIRPHLVFGEENIIAIQATGFMDRTEALDAIDPRQGRELATMGRLWPGQFEQYCVVGQDTMTPSWQVSGVDVAEEGDLGEVTFVLSSDVVGLQARVSYRWDAVRPWFTKGVCLTNATGRTLRVMNVRLGDYATPVEVSEGEQGFPVYLRSQYFVGVAHPAGWAMGMDGRVRLQQHPGRELAPGAELTCMDSVYGAAPAGTGARDLFIKYVSGRMRRASTGRAQGVSVLESFGSWPGARWMDVNERIILDHLEHVRAAQSEQGCHFDFYSIEFWVDYRGDMAAPDPARFPEGFSNIVRQLDAMGVRLGLWADNCLESLSIGGNPATRGCWTWDAAAYRVPDSTKWETLCRAAEPYRSLFVDGILHHIGANRLGLVKFDNLMSVCHNPGHGHLPGIYSTEAIQAAVVDDLGRLDRAGPELFIMLYWGHRSPWWLLHADTLFESGLALEASSPAAWPTLYARDGVTLCLDQAHAWCKDIPRLGKDSLGVWLSDWDWNSSVGAERWAEGVVMDMCRGSLLFQLWSDHGLLDGAGRRQAAFFVDLLKTHAACFRNPRLILGDPWRNEPYGYCCTDGERAFIALNNCTWQDVTVELRLDEAWGLVPRPRWQLIRWYPHPATLDTGESDVSSTVCLPLRPFEVVLLEAAPAASARSLPAPPQTEAVRSIFAEASRALALSVREPAAAVAASRRYEVSGILPACLQGGVLAVAGEITRDGRLAKLRDVGTHFSATASLADRATAVAAILGSKTYATPWQGWRVAVAPADRERSFTLWVDASLPSGALLSFQGHFVPR